MTFLQFLLTFWFGGVVAYGLSTFSSIKRAGLFNEGTWRKHLFAFTMVFIPGVLLWPVFTIRDVVKEK